ncbi:hypothetical protein EYF80_056469 [Liparis tanakae]|uniref:Uncharacterized protein n=1 Tax=Liparis tanakae TaxID=230148 RepID=A0A4Z2EX96_9TELE|nr:hypothetical protein EYF80_056469 [Liparis tanakae]
MMTSSGLERAGLFGILDSIKRRTNIEVFGLKETRQPTAFIGETHRQHERQRLHQAGVRLCWGEKKTSQRRRRRGLTWRQVWVQSRLLQTRGALLSRQRTLVLLYGLEGLQLSGRGVDFFGAQRVPERQQRVLRVRAPSLAGRAQVVVGTHGALEAGSHHGTLTAVTRYVTVQWGGGQVRGSTLRSSRRRRVAEGEGREGVKRKVSTILLLL